MHPEYSTLSKLAEFHDLQLETPCVKCGAKTSVSAAYFRAARKLLGFCKCGGKNVLDQYLYAKFIKKERRKLDFDFTPVESDHEIFTRCDFRCVFHEASEDARQFRLKQLDAVKDRFPSSQQALVFQEQSVQELLTGNRNEVVVAARNLWGLEIDHLFPRWVTLFLKDQLERSEWDLCTSRWVVASCVKCNQDRYHKLESSDVLLYVYSRFVMRHRGNELAQTADLIRFAAVLEKLERSGVRLSHPATAEGSR